jgi:hypothetical protein
MMIAYEPDNFIALLSSGRLPEFIDLSVVCLIKTTDGDASCISVSAAGGCEDWLQVPVAMIDKIQHLGDSRCKDHVHPMVKLSLKLSEKEKAVAKLFVKLSAQANHTRSTAPNSNRGAVSFEDAQTPPQLLRIGGGEDPCTGWFIGPCMRQSDGTYKQWKKTASTGCDEVLVPCLPRLTPDIVLQDDGANISVTGGGFFPGGEVRVEWSFKNPNGNGGYGSQSNFADANGKIPTITIGGNQKTSIFAQAFDIRTGSATPVRSIR